MSLSLGEVYGSVSFGSGELLGTYPPLGGEVDVTVELRETVTGYFVVSISDPGKCNKSTPPRAFRKRREAIAYACAIQNCTRPGLRPIEDAKSGSLGGLVIQPLV